MEEKLRESERISHEYCGRWIAARSRVHQLEITLTCAGLVLPPETPVVDFVLATGYDSKAQGNVAESVYKQGVDHNTVRAAKRRLC